MLSVARIAAYLGGVSGQDGYLSELEKAAVADVEQLTGRWLGAVKPFVDVRDVRRRPVGLTPPESPDAQSVRLSQPLAAVSDSVVEERFFPGGAWAEVAQVTPVTARDVFELDGHRLIRLIGAWPPGQRTVRVSYDFGYAEDAAPAGFCGVVLDLISCRYQAPALRSLPSRVTSATVRGANVTLSPGEAGGRIPDDLRARILALRSAGSF